jgi:hypothetical protein
LCGAWANRCAIDMPDCTNDEHAAYDRWLDLNKTLHAKLEDLASRKAFDGRLTASIRENGRDLRLGFDDPVFSRRVPPLTSYSDRIAELQADHSARVAELQDEIAKLHKETQRLQLFEPSNADSGGGVGRAPAIARPSHDSEVRLLSESDEASREESAHR